jgi:hypothetical protein
LVTGIFRLLLIEHFQRATNIENPDLQHLLYTTDEATLLWITDHTRWEPEKAGKRPAIVLQRGDWNHPKTATLGGQSGTTVEGNKKYITSWVGSHQIRCAAPEGGEVELLAAEVYRFLMHYGPYMRHNLNWSRFQIKHVGGPQRMPEETIHWSVPITVEYAWDESWVLVEAAPAMQNVTLSQLTGIGS